MKKLLLKYLLSALLLIGCLANCEHAFGRVSVPVLPALSNNIGGGIATPTVGFNFTKGQSSSTASSIGGTYTLPAPTINFARNTTGFTTSSTLVKGQTSIVLYGVTVTPTGGNITVLSPFINFNTGNGNPLGYFSSTSLELWMSTSGSFATANRITGASFDQSGTAIRAFLNSTANLTSGTNYTYYLVGNLNGTSNTYPVSLPFSVTGFDSNAGGTNYSGSTTTTTYNLVTANVTIADNNSAASGIYQGALAYGQQNIVLFSFSLTAQGTLTVGTMVIPSSTNMTQDFNNGRIYRSTDQYFSHAVLITSGATAAVDFAQGSYAVISGFDQTFSPTTSTTYYYFLVADFLKGTSYTAPSTVQYNFSPSQSPQAINYTSGNGDNFNGFTTSGGKLFSIVKSYDWVGTNSNFTDPANFALLSGGPAGSVPTNAVTVNIGTNITWTNAPTIPPASATTITIGGLSFGTKTANPSITIPTGKTLVVNNTLDVLASNNVTINGAGTLSLPSTNTANVVSGSTLNLALAAKVTTAGAFNMAPTSVLNVTGSSTLTNTGTMTLQSDATGSASVGPVTGSIAGNVNVQRYMSGGVGRRGYRLLSSPVWDNQTVSPAAPPTVNVYYLLYLQATTPITGWGTGTYSATQPTSPNFDKTSFGNPSALFYYEPDADPTNRTLAASDYKAFNNTTEFLPVGNGFLFYFRGTRALLDANGVSKVSSTAVPENTTLNNFGVLNQGDIKVYIPTNPLITSGSVKVYSQPSTSTDFSLTFSYTNHSSSSDGFHLVGNPYACTIDLEVALTPANFTNPASSTNNYIYALNNTGTFGSYLIGTPTSGTNGITRYISQGQGFFIRGSAAGATLKFTEASKVTGTAAPTSVFAATGGSLVPLQALRITLALDSLNNNETVVQFGYHNAKNTFSDLEDAAYIYGPSQTTFMASYSSDNYACLVNQMSTLDSIKTIPLYAEGQTTGRYTMTFTGASSLDPRYRLYLRDNLLKDSLDVSDNSTYTFNIDRNNTQTYGDQRFTLVVTRIANNYALTDFKAIKNTSSVILTWATVNESNYTNFIVQRSIDGGKTYMGIGSLLSDGSGGYSYTDTTPTTNGTNLYKLAQNNIYDLNNIALSNVVTVSYLTVNPATNKLVVYPNPVATTIKVALQANANSGSLAVKVYNVKGELMLSSTFAQGSVPSLDVSNLMQGTYIIRVNDDKTNYGSATFTKI